MFDFVGTIDNHTMLPAPVIDESDPKGYRIEQRMQVTLKAASNERSYTVEFRLGESSQAPSEQQLNAWLESGELVQAFCTGLSARPFVHQEGKQYRTRGKEVQFGDVRANLDSFVVFAGFEMAPLASDSALEDVVKQVRAAYKRGQREFRQQRNAERVAQMEAQLEERARQMLERRRAQMEQQAATSAASAVGAAGPETEAVSTTGRRGR